MYELNLAFLWRKKYQKRLEKHKKGSFGLFMEIMTLAMKYCYQVSESQAFAVNCITVF